MGVMGDPLSLSHVYAVRSSGPGRGSCSDLWVKWVGTVAELCP